MDNSTSYTVGTHAGNIYHGQYHPEDVFLLIMFIVLCIIGVFFNLHALIIYPLRFAVSNHQILITVLSTFNMLGSCLCIPLEITLILGHNEICKLARFLSHVVAIASGSMLAVIAVDRHRKICKPYRSQMNKKHIRYLCACVFFLSLLLAIPAAIFYIPRRNESKRYLNFTFNDCQRDSEVKNLEIYFAVIFFQGFTVLVICIVTYSLIIRTIILQRRTFKLKRQSHHRNLGNLDKSSSDADLKLFRTDRSLTGGESSSSSETRKNGRATPIVRSKMPIIHGSNEDRVIQWKFSNPSSNERKNGIISRKEIYDDPLSEHANQMSNVNITVLRKTGNPMTRAMRLATMFLVASILSVVWFFPQILFSLLKFAGGTVYSDVKNYIGAGKKIMENMYYVSYVTTPLVYCFMDEKFRVECRRAYISLYNKLKKICNT